MPMFINKISFLTSISHVFLPVYGFFGGFFYREYNEKILMINQLVECLFLFYYSNEIKNLLVS